MSELKKTVVITLEESISGDMSIELSSLGGPQWTYIDGTYARAEYSLELRRLRIMAELFRRATTLLERWNKPFRLDLCEGKIVKSSSMLEVSDLFAHGLRDLVPVGTKPLGLSRSQMAEQRESFRRLLLESELAEHSDYLLGLVVPEVVLEAFVEEHAIGRSKLGGCPDLPPGTSWPVHRAGPFEFIAQINFDEIQTDGTDLPDRGLLSLFAATRPYEEFEQFDEGFIWGEFTHEVSAVGPIAVPSLSNVQKEEDESPLGDCSHHALSLFTKQGVPTHSDQISDWPVSDPDNDEQRMEIHAKVTALWEKATGDKTELEENLLGYPSTATHGYLSTPGPEWVHLISLASHDNWCWHDGDFLQVFIERKKLLARDFSDLRSDAG